MKTALYSRVSTDKQANGLEAQTRALKDYCFVNGITSFEIFEDFNISGAKQSRPELDRLLDEESANVADLEEFIGRAIEFQVESIYSQEQYDIILV